MKTLKIDFEKWDLQEKEMCKKNEIKVSLEEVKQILKEVDALEKGIIPSVEDLELDLPKEEDREITQIDIPSLGVDPDAPQPFTDGMINGLEMAQRAKDLETLGLQDRDTQEQIKSDEREEFDLMLSLGSFPPNYLETLRPFKGESEEQWKERKWKVIFRLYGSK